MAGKEENMPGSLNGCMYFDDELSKYRCTATDPDPAILKYLHEEQDRVPYKCTKEEVVKTYRYDSSQLYCSKIHLSSEDLAEWLKERFDPWIANRPKAECETTTHRDLNMELVAGFFPGLVETTVKKTVCK